MLWGILDIIFVVASCGLHEPLSDHGHCFSAVMDCFPAPEWALTTVPAKGPGLEGRSIVSHFIGFHAQSSNHRGNHPEEMGSSF